MESRAVLRLARVSPRKARLVADLVRGLDVAQDDIHALASETIGKRSAHAAGGAGDDGGLVGEILHFSDRTRRPDPLVSLR